MQSDEFNALFGRYIDTFGEPPMMVIGMDDDTLASLMREALENGRPIPEEDYDRGLPDDAGR